MISEAARLSGFTESALRFYEREGIVVPERTASAYRMYQDDDLDALRFLRRAKLLGLRLDDIADLLHLLDDEECQPVQAKMRDLLEAKIAETERQAADLRALVTQLREVAGRLTVHTPDGPCDERCGCRTDRHTADRGVDHRTSEPDGASG